jgi:chromosome partitioning protein
VLGACTHALGILEAEPLALRVLPQLVQSLEEQRAHGAATALAGIILNCVQFRTGASLGVVQGAWATFAQGLVLETTVPRDTAFLDASEQGVPVAFLDRAKRPPVAAVFRHLADDIAERIGLFEVKPAGEPLRLL